MMEGCRLLKLDSKFKKEYKLVSMSWIDWMKHKSPNDSDVLEECV